jgi:uncharacterized protein
MPNFFDPFSGKVPDRKLTNEELIRAIRLDIAGENEAVHGYMAHVEATNNPMVKRVLTDIANEERVHIGELTHLLNVLTKGEECVFQKKGAREAKKTTSSKKKPKK